MCDRVSPRMVNCLSTVIGICDRNICAFAADTRKVEFNEDGSIYPVREDEEKIFSINGRLLLGGAGAFWKNETVMTPLLECNDIDVLNTDDAVQVIEEYLKKMIDDGRLRYMFRTYLIGGFDKNGDRSLYRVCYLPEKGYLGVDGCSFPKNMNGTIVIPMLPPNVQRQEEFYKAEIVKCLNGVSTVRELAERLHPIICDIADKDNSVNKTLRMLHV